MWPASTVALAVLAMVLAAALVARRNPGPEATEPALVPSVPGTEPSSVLAAAFDEVTMAVVIVDGDGRLVVRNRAAEPYGSGRHGEALVEASVRRRLREARGGQQSAEELRLHGPPERVLQIRGRPVVVAGQLAGAIAVVDDVTEQRRMEAMRRDFVANVSHELKTPVGALSLLAETLEHEDDPAVIHRFSTRIRHEATRLTELIDDLLDLSRIESGGSDREPVSIGAVIAEAVAAVIPLASAAEVEVSVSEPDGRSMVVGDRSQLVAAIVNLLDNAVKHTPAGGEIVVETRRVSDEISVVVDDTGVGIPHRDLHRVFERFYRVDRGRSAESGGTGLGLSIVRHVVMNHGGTVAVDSREGEGTTFTILLPAVDGTDSSERR